MPLLFAATMFVSAALLFMVQPMIGRLVLPLVGGSPAAWNTCMVFFQALLLAGYAYAHWLTSRISPRKQIVLHGAVIGGAILMLAASCLLGPKPSPIAVVPSLAPQGSAYPMFGMLALLTVAIGGPFFVVSTSAPLLQKWFAVSGHAAARDPYFLYAASNAGSLISLLGYPLFIEPNFPLLGQQWIWGIGFLALFALTMLCGRYAKHPMPIVGPTEPSMQEAPTTARKIRWIALAFVPSSLMLGVTFHMTTDITSMPLLWVPPLALYLLTFIIAFARLPGWFRPLIGNIGPVALLLLVFVLCASYEIGATGHDRAVMWLSLHVLIVFLITLMCHTEIAFDRPSPTHLTSYFLWMSFGGMLGGVFNGIIAPVLFPNAWEYPIAVAVSAFLVPVLGDLTPTTREGRARMLDLFIPLLMFALVAVLTLLLQWQYEDPDKLNAFQKWCVTSCREFSAWLTRTMAGWNFAGNIKSNTIAALIGYGLPCMLAFFAIDRPLRFGLCVSAILLVGIWRSEAGSTSLVKTRSYFGILKANAYESENKLSAFFYQKADNPNGDKVNFFINATEPHLQLVHGTTLHGKQAAGVWRYPGRDDLAPIGTWGGWPSLLVQGTLQAFDNRQEPLTYYHRTGPVGHMFQQAYAKFDKPHVGMIGLGTGSVAAYARPGLPFTFFEIDPAVLKIVDRTLPANRDDANQQFTYLADARARGAKIEMVLGDGRLKLEEQKDRKYSLLLVDAFSSDSIPLHLLTVEAVKLYMDRLESGGLLALHISNKFVDLEPVVAAIAGKLNLVGRCMQQGDGDYSGRTGSQWCVLARSDADLGRLGITVDEGRSDAESGLFGAAAWAATNLDWKPLEFNKDVLPWTDDYADVMRVMRMKEIKTIRGWFGLPTPGADD